MCKLFLNLHTLFYKLLSCISFREALLLRLSFLNYGKRTYYIKCNKNAIPAFKNFIRHKSAVSALVKTYICNELYYQGGNLEVLRVLLGHSSISITQIYIHLAAQMQLVNNKFDSHLDTLT